MWYTYSKGSMQCKEGAVHGEGWIVPEETFPQNRCNALSSHSPAGQEKRVSSTLTGRVCPVGHVPGTGAPAWTAEHDPGLPHKMCVRIMLFLCETASTMTSAYMVKVSRVLLPLPPAGRGLGIPFLGPRSSIPGQQRTWHWSTGLYCPGASDLGMAGSASTVGPAGGARHEPLSLTSAAVSRIRFRRVAPGR